MMTFVKSIHCRGEAHCAVCRTDQPWRRKYGAPERCPLGKPLGVGTELKRILGWIGFREAPGCPCRATAVTMDRMGPQWCRENRSRIIDAMAAEAAKRRVARWIFTRWGASLLVRWAIHRATKTTR